MMLDIIFQLFYITNIDNCLYRKGRKTMNDERMSLVLKAMADPSRLKIIKLLSRGTMCACEVLGYFEFTQPTLSHHMKVLEKAGIISVSKQGQWHHYTLKDNFERDLMASMAQLFAGGTG